MMNRDEVLQAFERTCAYARKYVGDNQEELRKMYGNKYLAIAENIDVIDVDNNKASLIKRLRASSDKRSIVIDNIVNLTKPKPCNN